MPTKPLKTAIEAAATFVDEQLPPPATPAKPNIPRAFNAAEQAQIEADALALEADDKRREARNKLDAANSLQRQVRADAGRLARCLWERKNFAKEAAMTVSEFDIALFEEMVAQHHLEAALYVGNTPRIGAAPAVVMPLPDSSGNIGQLTHGNKVALIAADFAGRQFRAAAGKKRLAELDAEIEVLKTRINTSVSEHGWDRDELLREAADGVLPVQIPVLKASEILDVLEANR